MLIKAQNGCIAAAVEFFLTMRNPIKNDLYLAFEF